MSEGSYPETIYGCWCGYASTTPGNCRSHPMPCRAMGPPMKPYRSVQPIKRPEPEPCSACGWIDSDGGIDIR